VIVRQEVKPAYLVVKSSSVRINLYCKCGLTSVKKGQGGATITISQWVALYPVHSITNHQPLDESFDYAVFAG